MPADMKIDGYGDVVAFGYSGQDSNRIMVESKTKFQGSSLADFADAYVTPKDKVALKKNETISLSGANAIKQTVNFSIQDERVKNAVFYFIEKKDEYLIFWFAEKNAVLAETIMNTFKFTK